MLALGGRYAPVSHPSALRVCIVTTAAYVHGIGGMQDHATGLAVGLAHSGHDVEVITSRHPQGLSETWQGGVRWRFVDVRGSFTDPAWLRASYEAFVRAHAERPFDVVHGEGSSALELVRRGLHRELPFVVMFHGNFLGHAKAAVRRGLASRRPIALLREGRHIVWLCQKHFPRGNWYRFRACEAIVPSRQQITDTCRSHFLKRSRVHVVPNGVDTKVFRPCHRAEARAELGLPEGPLFVCVGRLDPRKGFHQAIEALSLFGEEHSDARLVVVGAGEAFEALQAHARALKLEGRVIFTGAQPRKAVAKYLGAADVFLFPTQLNEAAPLVLPQAMACGLPVIASDVGAIPEVIDRPGENGLLVTPGNLPLLARSMQELVRDDARRKRLGEAARRRVLAQYTIERMAERTVAVYEVALGVRRRPAPLDEVRDRDDKRSAPTAQLP